MHPFILIGLLLVCTGCAGTHPDSTSVRNPLGDWLELGNADWRPTGAGVVAGPDSASGFLVLPGRFSDFTLTLEFRIEDDTNSGVFIRCRDAATITPFDCYEINIWDNHPNQDYRTGSIVTRQPPLANVDTLGDWNRMRIEAYGHRIVVEINDIVTALYEDGSLAEGFIALQYAGTNVVEFRNLRID